MKSQKTTLKKLGFSFALVFLLAGCADPASGTLEEIYKYPKSLWGEWIRMDTGKDWYITSNYLEGDLNVSSIKEISRQSPNVIEVVDEKNRKYYLYASRLPNGSFSGTIVGDESGRSSLNRFSSEYTSGMEAVIRNLNDAANETSTRTNDDGTFTVEGTIPGDEYEVTVDGQSTVVTPNTDGENIGTVTVTSGTNFKIGILPGSTDMMRLYSNESYGFSIVVTNTGTEDFRAANYSFTFPSGLIAIDDNPGGIRGILSTIEPGKYRLLTIAVNCPSITEEFEYKTIKLQLRTLNKTWDDSVSFKFNRNRVTFNINSKPKSISGVVIAPSAKAYHFETSGSSGSYSASVEVPKYSTEDYLVVFSGATADDETVYSLGAGIAADTIGASYEGGVYAYEPNNTEDTAALIPLGNKIMAYLEKNELDYYRVRF
jgi:hypothetical protein